MDPDHIAEARSWMDQLTTGDVASIEELGRRYRRDPGDISRALPLAFLAPDIVEAILEGRQPVDLTAEKLRRTPALPLDWAEQRRRLGCERR